MKNKENITNYIFLFIFSIGIMLIYFVQLIYPDPQPNPREEILYNGFEVFFSIGIGWVLQRISSRKEFQDSLKQFALSAYRRISDIEKSVNRIRIAIEKARLSYSKEKIHELDILSMATDELSNTVNSSIADWVDVIGDELDKKEKIIELQKEQQVLKSIAANSSGSGEAEGKVRQLQEEINALKLKLPYSLKEEVSIPYFEGTEKIQFVIDHFHREIRSHSCITFQVESINDGLKNKLEESLPLSLVVSITFSRSDLYLLNKDEVVIGRVINPFAEVSESDFINAFVVVLGVVTKATNTLSGGITFMKPFVLANAKVNKITSDYVEFSMAADDDGFAFG